MLLQTFLSLFSLDVAVEQKSSKFYVSAYSQDDFIVSTSGRSLNATMLKCFLKVVDLQGEAPEELQEYKYKLQRAYKIEQLVGSVSEIMLK